MKVEPVRVEPSVFYTVGVVLIAVAAGFGALVAILPEQYKIVGIGGAAVCSAVGLALEKA